jgi:hypothetical protein
VACEQEKHHVRTSATKHTRNRLSSTSQVFPKRL